MFGDEIKIHSGSRGGGTCNEGYTATAHLDRERAVIDDDSQSCWKCAGKARLSVTPE